MMSRMMNTTPPPTAAFMLPEGPGPGGEPPRRPRSPRSSAIFCCSFLRFSSRSGGPSLFFFPHWGSFGGIGNISGRGGQGSGSGPGGLGQRFAKAFDSRTGGRTHLDIQYLTMWVAHDFRHQSGHAVDLVVDEDLRHLGRADLFEHRVHRGDLLVALLARAVHHVQEEIGLDGLFQRRLERIDERVRQVADEPDRVRERDARVVAEIDAARGRVERGEELVGDEGLGAGDAIEERGLAGVGVTHERHAQDARAHAPGALRGALLAHLADALLQLLHLLADHAAVQFDLLLARAAGLAEGAALALQVRPALHEPRVEVLEARELDLELALGGPGALPEDVEDHVGAVEDADLGNLRDKRALEVAHLRGRELAIEDDDVGLVLEERHADLLDLALAGERGSIRTIAAPPNHLDTLPAPPFYHTCAFLGPLTGARCTADVEADEDC